jgi:hypothetical protein
MNTWLLRVALVATLILTASGEYVFATRVGWHPYVAWAMAVSLDIYVVVAMRAKRDVPWAIGLMAATNVAAHSVEMLPGLMVDGRPVWWLIAAASALPPVVLWRIHRLSGHHQSAVLTEADAGNNVPSAETVTTVTVDDEPLSGPDIRIPGGHIPGHVVGLSADYPPVSGYQADTASARPDTRVPEPVSVQASGYPPVSADTPDTTEAPSVRECVRAALSAHGPDMTRILPDIHAVHPDAKPDTVARYVRQLKGEGGYV